MQDLIEDIYPLSPVQQGMLFHCLYTPESGVYRVQLVLTLRGPLQSQAFRQAWEHVLAAMPILRSAFLWEGLEIPVQVVCRQVDVPWAFHDWRGRDTVMQEQLLQEWLEGDRERGFDLGAAPLLRFALCRLDDERYHFVWSHHHLLLDGWSVALVLKEVFVCYTAITRGERVMVEPRRPFRDYVGWLAQHRQDEAERFWRALVGDLTAPTPLGLDQPPDPAIAVTLHERVLRLSPEQTEALQRLARGAQLTVNTLLQGAWAILLSRYSGEAEVVFGVTVSGRALELAGIETMVGLLINTLPLRVEVPDEAAVLPWLQGLQDRQSALSRHEATSLVQLQGWSGVPRGVALFESILVFENYPVDTVLQGQPGGLALEDLRFVEQTNYPLALAIKPGHQLAVTLTYDARRFTEATAERLLGHLATVLAGMVATPNGTIGALPLLTEAEREQLLVTWNVTDAPYPSDQCFHQLFEQQAMRTPDELAVVAADDQLTYAELNLRANQLAHALRRRGVGPDVLVGLCCERSTTMLVGLLGILKAGGAYVPLDPAYPLERIAFTLADAQVPVLLTQQHLLEGRSFEVALNEEPQWALTTLETLCLDTDWPTIASEPSYCPESGVTPASLAYVIYTSGSTGRPKGAMIAHRSVLNLAAGLQGAIYDRQPRRRLRVSLNAALPFDASVQQLTALLYGHTLYIIPEGVRRDGPALLAYVRAYELDVLDCVPSQLQLLLAAGLLDGAGWTPGAVLPGGEAIDAVTWQTLAQAPATEFYNLYGPTECTVDATTTAVRLAPGKPTIGRPLANVRVYVLDKGRRPVPIGVAGELWIGGVGLARGYWNRPELTAERFVRTPFGDTQLLYRTGDLVRYLPDGKLEFLGRMDTQVKLRGLRIEPGEIEVLLRQHPGLHDAVVVVREDTPGDKRLVAYVRGLAHEERERLGEQREREGAHGARVNGPVAPGGPHGGAGVPPVDDIRRYLREKLPEYMVPAAFVTMPSWPLTPSGKIDRRALPVPDRRASVGATTYVAPRTPLEAALAEHWAAALGLAQVSITDDFFALGGHSLLVTSLVARLRTSFGVELPLRSLFEAPTVEQLAVVVAQAQLAQAEEAHALDMLATLEQLSDDEVLRFLAT